MYAFKVRLMFHYDRLPIPLQSSTLKTRSAEFSIVTLFSESELQAGGLHEYVHTSILFRFTKYEGFQNVQTFMQKKTQKTGA